MLESIDALGYLYRQGVQFKELAADRSKQERDTLVGLLRTAMPWLPARPMPHGRIVDYYWNHFPWDLEPLPDQRTLVRELRRWKEVYAIFEDPTLPVYRIQTASLPDKGLLPQDLYFLPLRGATCAFAMGHEPAYGPWKIERDRRLGLSEAQLKALKKDSPRENAVRTAKDATAYWSRNGLTGEVLSPRQMAAVRRSVLKALGSKGVRLPEHPLQEGPIYTDHWWNYFPPVTEFEPLGDQPYAWVFACSSRVLLMFASAGLRGLVVDPESLDIPSLEPENFYVLDWPTRHWLLALPKEFLAGGVDESFVLPSYVRLV
jgi:hypothetical protein